MAHFLPLLLNSINNLLSMFIKDTTRHACFISVKISPKIFIYI